MSILSETSTESVSVVKEEVLEEVRPIFSFQQSPDLQMVLSNPGGSVNSSLDSSVRETSHMNSNDGDDCILLGENVPLPLQSTRDGLVKRENDVLSGNKPFILTVRFHLLFYF